VATNDELESLRALVRELEQELGNLKVKLKSITSEYAALDGKVARVDKKTDEIERLAKDLQKLFSSHKKQLEQIQINIETLSEDIVLITSLRDDLKNSLEKLDEYYRQVETLNMFPEKLEDLRTQFGEVKIITDSVKGFAKIVAAAIVVLVVNSIFGG